MTADDDVLAPIEEGSDASSDATRPHDDFIKGVYVKFVDQTDR